MLFGISPPLAKILLGDIPPVELAGLLYLGSFIGLSLYSTIGRKPNAEVERTVLEGKDYLWLAGSIGAGG